MDLNCRCSSDVYDATLNPATRWPDDIDEALRRLWDDPAQPALLQVVVDAYANVYPKIAFGRPITEMEPFAKPIEMEST